MVSNKLFTNGSFTFPKFSRIRLEHFKFVLIGGEISYENHVQAEEWLKGN